jgi:hypothetical protein
MSGAISAATRALQGETDPCAILDALRDYNISCMLAFAPHIDRRIRCLAALSGGWTDMLTGDDIADPSLHDAIRALIGRQPGWSFWRAWAHIAPPGWGANVADALLADVKASRVPNDAAAILIGPCDRSARILQYHEDVAQVIRAWGQAHPNDPTWWTAHVSDADRSRFLKTLQCDSRCLVACSLWLPIDLTTVKMEENLSIALNAFAEASAPTRMLHARILQNLVKRALRVDAIPPLLALAQQGATDAAWSTLIRQIKRSPVRSVTVLKHAPWDTLPGEVAAIMRAAVAEASVRNMECAAIAYACGERTDAPMRMNAHVVHAFFAAVTPEVWKGLSLSEQRNWLGHIDSYGANLAVRSLGPAPDILPYVEISHSLTYAIRRWAPEPDDMRDLLFPLAISKLDSRDAHAAIAALPTPPSDPLRFARIVCRQQARANGIAESCHVSSSAIADVVGLAKDLRRTHDIRALSQHLRATIGAKDASWGRFAHHVLSPNPHDLADVLAPPSRRDDLAQELDAIARLPPATSIPTLIILKRLAYEYERYQQFEAGREIASLLRDHGTHFAALVTLVNASVRAALFPLPRKPTLRATLLACACRNPPAGRSVAIAIHDADITGLCKALRTMSSDDAMTIWRSIIDDSPIPGICNLHDLASALADNGKERDMTEYLRYILRAIPPIDAMDVMDALQEAARIDPALTPKDHRTIASHAEAIRPVFFLARHDVQRALLTNDTLSIQVADAPDKGSAPPPRSQHRRMGTRR